jgi:O-antigen ligase
MEPPRSSPSGPPGGTFNIVFSMLMAIGLMLMIIVLHYQFEQAQHRLIKIVLGFGAVMIILMKPLFGLFLFPIGVPFLSMLPKIPVPGFNTLNAFLFMLFISTALTRVLNRLVIFPRMRLAWPIAFMVLVLFVGWIRGVVFPVDPGYDVGQAGLNLFRLCVGFIPYFVGISMVRGHEMRRPMVWAVIIAVGAEAVATIHLGGQGRAGRAEGTMGQANDLGAYLATYTVFAAAYLTAVPRLQRLVIIGIVALGSIGVLMSVSRGAMVALGVGLIIVALRSSRLLAGLVILAMLTSPLWAPENVKERIMSTQTETEDSNTSELEPSALARVNTWKTIAFIVGEHPIDGVGFDGLHYVLKPTGQRLGLEYVVSSAHNTFFRLLGDHGIPGLLIFVYLILRMLSLSQDAMRLSANRFDRQTGVGASAAIISLCLASWFGDRFFRVEIIAGLWLVCGLLDDICLARDACPAEDRQQSIRQSRSVALSAPER